MSVVSSPQLAAPGEHPGDPGPTWVCLWSLSQVTPSSLMLLFYSLVSLTHHWSCLSEGKPCRRGWVLRESCCTCPELVPDWSFAHVFLWFSFLCLCFGDTCVCVAWLEQWRSWERTALWESTWSLTAPPSVDGECVCTQTTDLGTVHSHAQSFVKLWKCRSDFFILDLHSFLSLTTFTFSSLTWLHLIAAELTWPVVTELQHYV